MKKLKEKTFLDHARETFKDHLQYLTKKRRRVALRKPFIEEVAKWAMKEGLETTKWPHEINISSYDATVTSVDADTSWKRLESLMDGRDLKVQKVVTNAYDESGLAWGFRLWLHEDFYVTFAPAEPDPDCVPTKHIHHITNVSWTCEKK